MSDMIIWEKDECRSYDSRDSYVAYCGEWVLRATQRKKQGPRRHRDDVSWLGSASLPFVVSIQCHGMTSEKEAKEAAEGAMSRWMGDKT